MDKFIHISWNRFGLDLHLKFEILQEICTIAADAKNCYYMLPIVAFFGTTTIHRVYCGILQRQDIKPSQYICFSSGNLDIAALQNPPQ